MQITTFMAIESKHLLVTLSLINQQHSPYDQILWHHHLTLHRSSSPLPLWPSHLLRLVSVEPLWPYPLPFQLQMQMQLTSSSASSLASWRRNGGTRPPVRLL